MSIPFTNWKKGNIKNPYEKNIYNVACKGNTHSKINGIKKESYKTWYATRAVRFFLERWRKEYKKSLRHWLVTEIGGNYT